MNKYYKVFASYECVAVRQNGIKYNAPGEPVKASKKLKELARLGLIPTLLPDGANSFIAL